MTNHHDKAIEAAAKALWDMANPDMTWEDAKADPAQAAFVQWDMECARHAIAAYEREMWRPIEEHDGSKDHVLLGSKTKRLNRAAVSYYYTSPNGSSVWIGSQKPSHFRLLPTVPEGESMRESWWKISQRSVDAFVYLGFPAIVWWGYPWPNMLAWLGVIGAALCGISFVLGVAIKIMERRLND